MPERQAFLTRSLQEPGNDLKKMEIASCFRLRRLSGLTSSDLSRRIGLWKKRGGSLKAKCVSKVRTLISSQDSRPFGAHFDCSESGEQNVLVTHETGKIGTVRRKGQRLKEKKRLEKLKGSKRLQTVVLEIQIGLLFQVRRESSD